MQITSDHDPLLALGGRKKIRDEARKIREKYFGNIVTASKNYFIPLIKYCRNACQYCGFSRKSEISKEFEDMVVNLDQLKDKLKEAKEYNCKEILFVLGDRPEQINRKVREFLEANDCENAVDYTVKACKMAVSMGLQPHVNLGVITRKEWEKLKPVVASAGLMLENISNRLTEKGQVHYASPDKIPKARIESIKAALELEIPFTSGLLVGIGETDEERIKTIETLANLANEFETLQEVIVQPFHPLPNTPMRNTEECPPYLLLDTISATRYILPPSLNVQFPPNLSGFPIHYGINAGANDLGGISPITPDYVNYSSPWPKWNFLMKQLRSYGYDLVERGPVYEKWKKYSILHEKHKVT